MDNTTRGESGLKKEIRLYNLLFPVWMLWLIPVTWLIILPANFLIDSLVLLAALKITRQKDVFGIYKKSILKVYGFGFLADFAGVAVLLLFDRLIITLADPRFGAFGETMDYIRLCVEYSPFNHICALIVVLFAVAVSAFLIYQLNLHVTFQKLDAADREKRILARSLAILTAPYLILLPYGFYASLLNL
ncbi:hypothetical protein SDC9_90474 [bioreactor metagenome]|uniref:Uncharacterized protein n=1 Tax=bioreactor metagenome TaxID=1076179 RepID=A0A644ZSS4_9ZZZZ